jgi:hypothetical protein
MGYKLITMSVSVLVSSFFLITSLFNVFSVSNVLLAFWWMSYGIGIASLGIGKDEDEDAMS